MNGPSTEQKEERTEDLPRRFLPMWQGVVVETSLWGPVGLRRRLPPNIIEVNNAGLSV